MRSTLAPLTCTAGDFELKVRGRIIKFDGHTRVQGSPVRKDGDIALPDIRCPEFRSD